MQLWAQWWWYVQGLHPACARWRTFAGMVLVLVGLSVRSDWAGVTSLVRAVGLHPKLYRRLLHVFHSDGLDLNTLTKLWCVLALKLFAPLRANGRIVCLADGLKVAKEGKKMPGVKKLHQESQNNSKPQYIMGHSFQAICLLVWGPAQCVVAVPLVSRIHEGLLWSRNCKRTLLDKMAQLFLEVATHLDQPLILVADAYYGSRKLVLPLLKERHHLLARLRITAVAYHPAPKPKKRKRGRPKFYGEKVRLRDLAKDTAAFITAASPVYGESGVELAYQCIDLLWRPIGRMARYRHESPRHHRPLRVSIQNRGLLPPGAARHRRLWLSLLDEDDDTHPKEQQGTEDPQQVSQVPTCGQKKTQGLSRLCSVGLHRTRSPSAPRAELRQPRMETLSQLAAHHAYAQTPIRTRRRLCLAPQPLRISHGYARRP